MKEIWKSKVVRVSLLIALLICVASAVLTASGHASIITGAVRSAVTPLQSGFTALCETAEGFFKRISGYPALEEENRKLKERLAASEDLLNEAKAALEREKTLEEYLDLKKENPSFTFCEAKIIGRGNEGVALFFTLDKGSRDGIDEGMAVLDGQKLVGRVGEVGLNWSRVTGILQDGFSAGCLLERTGAVCVAEGSYLAQKEGKGLLTYLPVDTDVQEGDRVLTSGAGGTFPEGLIVGEVCEIAPDPVTRELTVRFLPAADFSSLHTVMILKEAG